MRAWRAVALSCVLAVGCGGPLPEETPPSVGTETAESLSQEAGAGEVSASWNNEHPTLSRARLVKDIFPDTAFHGPEPESLVDFRGKLFFAANREDGRRQLWKSNGTEAGTVVVAEFPPLSGPRTGFEALTSLTPVGHRLFFTVGDEAHGNELWVSDGTTGGTRLVADLTPGPGNTAPHALMAAGGTLFFFRTVRTGPDVPGRTELWTSDGTASGTVRLRDFGEGTDTVSPWVVARGDTLIFLVPDADGSFELWKSDGSRAGTQRLRTFSPASQDANPNSLRVAGRFVYFFTGGLGHGDALWRTDGTAAGTERVVELSPGPASILSDVLGVVDDRLFFTLQGQSAADLRLYALKADCSSHCVPKLVTTLPNPFAGRPEVFSFITAFATTDKQLFFSLAFFSGGPAPITHQLWVTDGTSSGTLLLQGTLSSSDEFTTELFPVDGLLLFPANNAGRANTEPWVSDGTVKGTRLLQDINPGLFSSLPHAFTRVNDCIFFIARREDVGSALWVLHVRH